MAATEPMGGQVNPFEFTITQTADSVTIRTPLNNPESVTLKLNGEETRTQIGGGQGGAGAATVTSRAEWEGSKLVVMSAVTGGRGGPGSARQAYSLSGDTLTLEMSNSLPDGSMTPVRTVTYVKYIAGADARAADPDGRVRLREPLQRQGSDRLEGERESRFIQGRERRHRRQRRRPGRRTCSTTGRLATMRFRISICGSTCWRAIARMAASTS